MFSGKIRTARVAPKKQFRSLPLPKMSLLEDLVSSWQNELDRQLGKIANCDKTIGSYSASLNGLTGCSGNDSHTIGKYCDLAILKAKKIVPRGKAWSKLYDLDRNKGYGF